MPDFIEREDEVNPCGNVQYIADNGITIDEVEDVLYGRDGRDVASRSSGRPSRIGTTSTGKTIIVIYERRKDPGDVIVRPVTGYEIEG